MNDDLMPGHEKTIQLHDAAHRQISDKISAVCSLWSDLTIFPWTYDKAQQLHQLVCALVGMSEAAGAAMVSRLAAELEIQLQKMVSQGAVPPNEQQRKDLAQLVTALQRLSDTDAMDSDFDSHHQTNQAGLLIYVVDESRSQAERMAAEIEHVGYKAQTFTDIQAFKAACIRSKKPAAVVMGMAFSECEDAGAKAMDNLRRDYALTVPVIFVSERSDIEARLLALRAGAVHCLVKPFSVNRLTRLLDEATLRSPLRPYRVLLVDDDCSLLEFHSALLEERGMVTSMLSDPLQTLEAIQSFNPDVIILDIYMPGCSGIELAMILDDDASFAEIPLLFLSLEQSHEQQLAALSMGGDDFLCKPVDPQDFIKTVKLRARKGRRIRELYGDLRRALDNP